MLLNLFLTLILLSTLFAIKDWRMGLYLLILIGAIQDPIRKMVPYAPAYLVLATAPVWAGILFGRLNQLQPMWINFRRSFKRLSKTIVLFVVLMIPPALLSATYGPGSWRVTLVGAFSYLGLLICVVFGYGSFTDSRAIQRVLAFYCLATAVMLIGTPIEYLGLHFGFPALGTQSMGHAWIRYIPGHQIRMIAGFYRSPDVMGWHSVMMTMFAAILALRSRGAYRYFWIAIAAWGIVGAFLCGRRKMFLMLPVFSFALYMLYWRIKVKLRTVQVIAFCLMVGGLGYYLYNRMGPSEDVEAYYFDNPAIIADRVEAHGFDAVISTYNQSGFWGEGLGTATQGTHHLNVSKPRTWQESGPSRLMVELGVPGFVCFIYLVYVSFLTIWKIVVPEIARDPDQFPLFAGLVAVILANAGSFVVSHQIFGDPYIAVFFPLLIGFALSGVRVVGGR